MEKKAESVTAERLVSGAGGLQALGRCETTFHLVHMQKFVPACYQVKSETNEMVGLKGLIARKSCCLVDFCFYIFVFVFIFYFSEY